jgi:hypothetical protein
MLGLPFNHTVTIILITVVISLIAFSNQKVMNRCYFGRQPSVVASMTDLLAMALFMQMARTYCST